MMRSLKSWIALAFLMAFCLGCGGGGGGKAEVNTQPVEKPKIVDLKAPTAN